MKRKRSAQGVRKAKKASRSNGAALRHSEMRISKGSNRDAKIKQHWLCRVCRTLVRDSNILNGRHQEVNMSTDQDSGKDERREQFVHHAGMKRLRASALAGCHLCVKLLDNLDYHLGKGYFAFTDQDRHEIEPEGEDVADDLVQQIHPALWLGIMHKQRQRKRRHLARQRYAQLEELGNPTDPTIIAQISYDGGFHDESSRISINVEPNGRIGVPMETDGRRAICLRPVTDKNKRKGEVGQDAPVDDHHDAQVSIDTRSRSSFDLARQWLSECVGNHPLCREVNNSKFVLPARLIDVGSVPASTTVRVCNTSDLKTRPIYVALSHCWGEVETVRLLQENKVAFKDNLKYEDLPLTFQDAISITRQLRHRFLWIDSLCIVQDCKEDWKSESSVMGDIYRGSLFTISAMAAKDANGGCFAERNPLLWWPCRLNNTHGKPLVAHGVSLHYQVEGALASRAWVVQEWTLSPRTLHYTKDAIYWECIEKYASEVWVRGDISWEKNPRIRRPKEAFQSLISSYRLQAGAPDVSYNDFRNFHSTWFEILKNFSSCSLTQPGDKLVAIRGIIRTIETKTGLTNVAGMWNDFLLPELLWYTPTPTNSLRPSYTDKKAYRAPTWSWASVDTIVLNCMPDLVGGRYENILDLSMFVSYQFEWKAEIVQHDVSARPNGEVTAGVLVLKAPVRKVEWAENSGARARKHSDHARSVNDSWSSDFRAGISCDSFAVLIGRGTSSSNVKGGRIDVGLVVEPHPTRGFCCRYGVFQQCYWEGDTYPIFAEQRDQEKKIMVLA
ncbi:uncharacterized protein KY384_004721 [Bacidia gigantensis]|uniref:uncharacterized protein n=1 Tax=Bacidia gigantensis TaxID=2732470 RepID=UPI001D05088D|nr:uncharacterized protein KY384_004721 [Bacidia gigantensis]KAG8530221.1 hypothetical protein KY384_004721 [Bacidia gigantensis]